MKKDKMTEFTLPTAEKAVTAPVMPTLETPGKLPDVPTAAETQTTLVAPNSVEVLPFKPKNRPLPWYAPSNWDIVPEGEDIRAYSSITGETFVGNRKTFSAMLRNE